MEDVKNLEALDSTDALFDDYFENMDLDSDIRKLYELIDDEDLQDEFERKAKLNKLRNQNHKRYYDINIAKLENLPYDLDDIIKEVLNLYSFIDYKNLLTCDLDTAENTKKLLDNICRKLNKLDKLVNSTLKDLTKKNDEQQSKFSLDYFENLDIEEKVKKDLIEKYNELVLYSSVITKDIYEDLKRQIKRTEFINNLLKTLHIEEEHKLSISKKEKLDEINRKINIEILRYKEKLNYLDDLIMEGSKYTEEFNDFKNFCNKIIAYDDNSYENAKQTYEILCDDSRFRISINQFEELFIKEREDNKKEETFVYEKFGIKNIKTSLNYITANYMDSLDEESKNIIEYIYNKINSNNYDLDQISKALNLIVRDIWKNTITEVHSYNPKESYYFLCTNNQFRDPKYQAILISKNEIERVDDYSDYQIGFICGYNDNIMYITENDDIMTVDHDDLSSLKTPLQLEQEFINFRVCNRIALNGYQTKIEAVYFINDGNKELYDKALELANMYNLPLIELKKDN